MSDWGECKKNLDTLLEMEPLSEREDKIALMQFEYSGSWEIADKFLDHPIVVRWMKEEKYFKS